ncbi:MAG TPA: class I SAM-dependent methyltransferase [Burkholderiales bacterium]|nr:class I SAM-dependent methyltransferase [Burkholderiales bacterium]
MKPDQATAEAFASSWNNLPAGSVYTEEQVKDWFAPLSPDAIRGKRVLEMGCGNGSLMMHVLRWSPQRLVGIDLGSSVLSATRNLEASGAGNWAVQQEDLTTFTSEGFDVVYSIGVLHHLKDPKQGFDAVVRNTKPGGRFHCWVYAREGNDVIIAIVDPIRRVAATLPWWLTKYGLATPLSVPYFAYAKLLNALPRWGVLRHLPLYEYSLWIAKREFGFFRHVAFDQLVTPQTRYIDRATIQRWLSEHPRIEPASTYVIMRNGNSWKFGGVAR